MISKFIRPLIYGAFGFMLSINDISFKDVSFWIMIVYSIS